MDRGLIVPAALPIEAAAAIPWTLTRFFAHRVRPFHKPLCSKPSSRILPRLASFSLAHLRDAVEYRTASNFHLNFMQVPVQRPA